MRPPPGLPSRDCPGALWADLTLEEGGRGDGRCRRCLPQQTDSSVPGMPKMGCRCRVHAIAPHWPGGVGSPALASPPGRERKSLRGVGLTSLLFSHWLKERRDQGTRPGAREASEAPVSPRSAPVSPRSAPAKVSTCGHASSGLFLWGVGPQEVSGKGRVGASHTVIFIGGGCAGSQAAGGVCWAEGGSALCRSEGDTGVPRRPTQACRRPRPGTPGLGWVLLTSTSGWGAVGFPQPLRRFAAHPRGPVPTNPLPPAPHSATAWV